MRLRATILVLFLVSTVTAAPTTRKAERPSEAIGQAGCVRAECHADIRNYPVVHGPVGVNACDACHELTDAEAHTFRVTREKAELCTYCHEFDVRGMPLVHEPVARGECLGCHDPHGGSSTQLLREASVAELCNRCHESITRGRSLLHTPVSKGACESCHPPHASRFPLLLDAVGPDLCLACHGDFEARMGRVPFTHKALENGCQQCHDVHGSNYRMSTTQPVRQQCAGCHENIMTLAANARVKHSAVTDERACMNCHTPHGSSMDKLVSDVPATLCRNCHEKEIKTDRGTVVAAMPDVVSPQGHVHGALDEGRCAGCHAPHGGDQADLLTKFYSTRFYQRFSPDRYALCFSCHDARLAQQRATTTLTGFRNGENNLHFVHVNLQGERGENCRVCHATHAGGGDRGVRERVRYGTWEMPIRFTKTDTGGSCFPGCHPLYGYDRERPLLNKLAPRPSQQQSVARAASEQPTIVELRANDIAGSPVIVPDARRTFVLLVALAGQQETQRALKRLSANPPNADEVQVLIVLNGAGATEVARGMNLPWPIIADPDRLISRELDVHGWPTALIVAPGDGTEVARVGGTANSLALKLAAYLDLAAGRVDGATAQRRATTREVVGDVAVEQRSAVSRDLYAAEQLIAAGRFAQARQILVRVLPLNLEPARTHYLMGRVLEHEQDWQGAAREYRAMRDAAAGQ